MTDWLLAIDTATARIVVAAGRPDGAPIRVMSWAAGHRHGEQLLAGVEEVMASAGLERREICGVIVGTGPGAFTGLRVGLATAKTLAHAMRIPIVGVGSGDALLEAANGSGQGSGGAAPASVLLLPAGPRDRVEVRPGLPARLLPGGTEPELAGDERLIAVDLEGRAPADAIQRGAAALDGLGVALLRLGAARLAAGAADDEELLVPEYVTLPRGVASTGGAIAWSSDRP